MRTQNESTINRKLVDKEMHDDRKEKAKEIDGYKETFIKNYLHHGTPQTQDVCCQEYRPRMRSECVFEFNKPLY